MTVTGLVTANPIVRPGGLEVLIEELLDLRRPANLLILPYFDRKAYLAQSPQFYKQMAMAAGREIWVQFRLPDRSEGHSKCYHRFKEDKKAVYDWPPPFANRL